MFASLTFITVRAPARQADDEAEAPELKQIEHELALARLKRIKLEVEDEASADEIEKDLRRVAKEEATASPLARHAAASSVSST